MLDILAGKPSATLRRAVLLLLLGLSTRTLLRPSSAGPPRLFRPLDSALSKLNLPAWKLLLLFYAASTVADNFFLLLFLNPPEPERGVYKKSFFRAQKILEALDSGFWTAMNISPAPLRHFLSLLFSIYFLLNPSKCDSVSRRFRAQATVKQLRLSWEKGHVNPILRSIRWLTTPSIATVREIQLPRPVPASASAFDGVPGPIRTVLYFDGDQEELKKSDGLILHFPGGGFCSMPPEVHEDYLRLWAIDTGLPILSVDYGKSPEFPYPWALEECFDAYRTLVESNGEAIGMGGWYVELPSGSRRRRKPIRVAVAGDSAGGNLAAACTFKILEFSLHHLPAPSGLLLTYPALSFDMAAWMPSDEIELLRAESRKSLAGGVGSNTSFGSGTALAGGKQPAALGNKETSAGPPSFPGSLGPNGSIMRNTSGLLEVPAPAVESNSSDLRRKRTLSFVEKHHRGMLGALSSHEPKKAPMPTSKSATDLRTIEQSSPLAFTLSPPPLVVPQTSVPWYWRVWDKVTSFRAAPSSRVENVPTSHRNVSMTSRFAFSGDKVLPPEVVRSLALLYVGNSPSPPDFGSDYFLNPNVAPDDLLARFPKVYLICGEKDPMVDDTVVFAGRVREAKVRAHRQWLKLKDRRRSHRQFGLDSEQASWTDADLASHVFAREPSEMVHTRILEGMSHGWLNIMALLPEAKDIVRLNAGWLLDLVGEDDRLPRYAPFPGYVRTSGREALAEEELTEAMMRMMEKEDGAELEDVVEVPARAGYYASVPSQIHRYLNPESAHGAVHGKEVREHWVREAEGMGMPTGESSEDEDADGSAVRRDKGSGGVVPSPPPASTSSKPAAGGRKTSIGTIRPARSRPRLSPQLVEGSDEEDSEDDSPITMKTIRKAPSDFASQGVSSAGLQTVSDAELMKRRKEEVEHALTDFHANK